MVDENLNVYVTKSYGARPDQNSAEWIDERPSCGIDAYGQMALSELADFQYTQWRQAEANNGSGVEVVDWYSDVRHLTMTENPTVTYYLGWNTDNTLASPSSLGSDGASWRNNWDYWGNDGECS